MSSVNFKDFKETPTVSIQFSYPVVDNVIYDRTTSSFFLPNNSVAPNFAYTDGVNNLYISGATIKGYISSSNIKSNPELVLEHQSSSSDKKFYVVIPLKNDTKATSSLSKLKSGSKVSLDLNKDIPQKNTIYHYLSTGGLHVFVFDAPISIKPNVLSVQNISGVPTSGGQKYKISSNTKVEDEVVCEYSEDSDEKQGVDKTTTTVATSFGSLLLNIMLLAIFLYLFKNYGDKLLRDDMLHIFVVIASVMVWLITFGFFMWFTNKKKTNYTIITGSLLLTATFVFSVVFFPDSDFAKMVKTATVVTPSSVLPSGVLPSGVLPSPSGAVPKGLFDATKLITGRSS